jgi:hypothetical protein
VSQNFSAKPPAVAKATDPGVAKSAPVVKELDLPEGTQLQKKGLLEVVTSGKHLIYVDGLFVGAGPLRRVPVDPGSHAVEARLDGEQLTHSVQAKSKRRTQITFPGDG